MHYVFWNKKTNFFLSSSYGFDIFFSFPLTIWIYTSVLHILLSVFCAVSFPVSLVPKQMWLLVPSSAFCVMVAGSLKNIRSYVKKEKRGEKNCKLVINELVSKLFLTWKLRGCVQFSCNLTTQWPSVICFYIMHSTANPAFQFSISAKHPDLDEPEGFWMISTCE